MAFPTPVVVACTGHSVAMGVFLLLSGDYRVGPTGPYKFTANEVAIGLTMPLAAVEICRQRLAPAQLNRAVAPRGGLLARRGCGGRLLGPPGRCF